MTCSWVGTKSIDLPDWNNVLVDPLADGKQTPMKALRIRQPWAWLLANGYKDIENRTWNTNFGGAFLIHAGKAFDDAGYAWVKRNFPRIPMPKKEEFQRGGIVGKAK